MRDRIQRNIEEQLALMQDYAQAAKELDRVQSQVGDWVSTCNRINDQLKKKQEELPQLITQAAALAWVESQ